MSYNDMCSAGTSGNTIVANSTTVLLAGDAIAGKGIGKNVLV